jgi:hypothetical protein
MTSNSFLSHQEVFNAVASHFFAPRSTAHYLRSYPLGSFVNPLDHTAGIEGVPVGYLVECSSAIPRYLDQGVVALKRALLRSRVNVYDPMTVALLARLQNLHDLFARWEWPHRLVSIAREFGLKCDLLPLARESHGG